MDTSGLHSSPFLFGGIYHSIVVEVSRLWAEINGMYRSGVFAGYWRRHGSRQWSQGQVAGAPLGIFPGLTDNYWQSRGPQGPQEGENTASWSSKWEAKGWELAL